MDQWSEEGSAVVCGLGLLPPFSNIPRAPGVFMIVRGHSRQPWCRSCSRDGLVQGFWGGWRIFDAGKLDAFLRKLETLSEGTVEVIVLRGRQEEGGQRKKSVLTA